MRKASVLTILVCLLAMTNIILADTIRGINIEFVTIGNPANPGDTRVGRDQYEQPLADPYNGGAVSYMYRIGKYEVTNAQWNKFTAAAGAPAGNPYDAYIRSAYYTGAQQPVNCVSWYEAAQFCNWLTSGNKSKGAYRFSGNNANAGDFWGVNREAAITAYGTIYVIPNENEWYKAAYFKPNSSGYSLYANGTAIPPVAGIDANYNAVKSQPWNVGSGTIEQNGTFDMMGNVWEWNETLKSSTGRGFRGGSCLYGATGSLGSSYGGGYSNPYYEGGGEIGFRIACIIPEPATLLLLGLGGVLIRRKK